MLLRVRYPNVTFDYVSTQMIDEFIAEKRIIKFYRPSGQQWIDIERDTIRRAKNRKYKGIERRGVGVS
jgi:hypothetical protein